MSEREDPAAPSKAPNEDNPHGGVPAEGDEGRENAEASPRIEEPERPGQTEVPAEDEQ